MWTSVGKITTAITWNLCGLHCVCILLFFCLLASWVLYCISIVVMYLQYEFIIIIGIVIFCVTSSHWLVFFFVVVCSRCVYKFCIVWFVQIEQEAWKLLKSLQPEIMHKIVHSFINLNSFFFLLRRYVRHLLFIESLCVHTFMLQHQQQNWTHKYTLWLNLYSVRWQNLLFTRAKATSKNGDSFLLGERNIRIN